jgi:hypothetical protein
VASASPFGIVLSVEERRELECRARAYSGTYWRVMRAKIVLLAAEGSTNVEIAARLDTSPQVVWRWRKRFYERRLEGLGGSGALGSAPGLSPLGPPVTKDWHSRSVMPTPTGIPRWDLRPK